MFTVCIVIGIITVGQCNNVKYWVHSNNWDNPKNWDFSPSPCDAVILPDLDYDYSVLLNSNVQLDSMQFPSTGEVIFGERASMSMSGVDQCMSGVTNTYRTEQYNWGDPNNWFTSTNTPSSIFSLTDSDKIPCWTDTIIFNETSVFSVLVDNSVEIGALYFGDQSMNTEDVKEFTKGVGRSQLQFINLSKLSITGRTCSNLEGCLCGNELDCSLVQCPRQNCVKPIKSKGICCHHCGAEVRFIPPAGFYLVKFKDTLANYLRDITDLKDIKLTISLQEIESRINIQITVTDDKTDENFEGAGYKSSKIAQNIYDYILQYYSVRSSDVRMQQSHQPFATETQKPENLGPQYNGIQSWVLYVVLSVSVVMLLVIIVLLVKCSQRHRNENNNNMRFDSGALPRTLERRFKPCVPVPIDQDIPTYEEVLMEDMLSRGIASGQPRSAERATSTARALRGGPRPGYAEIPTTDISDHSRV